MSSPQVPNGHDADKTPARPDELAQLKAQIRLLKAENSSLREKTGTKQQFAPFGQGTTTPRQRKESSNSLNQSTSRPRRPSSKSDHPPSSVSPGPGAVSLSRALFDGASPTPAPDLPDTEELSSPTADRLTKHSSTSSIGGRPTMENPFFGGGNTRDRMKNSVASANSGSGKVISSLQSELIQIKSTLETARAQLKQSQKAVEVLTRQNEDLKDAKERFNSETDGLNKMFTRKERQHEEMQTRALNAEAALEKLQTSHSDSISSAELRIKELEEQLATAQLLKEKAESEYVSIRGGMKSLADGWSSELEWVRADITKLAAKWQRESEEVKNKAGHLGLIYEEKIKRAEEEESLQNAARNSEKQQLEKIEKNLDELNRKFEAHQKVTQLDKAVEIAETSRAELKRLRNMIRRADTERHPPST